MKVTLRVTATLISLWLVACIPLGTRAERMTYPDTWPRLAVDARCQSVNGDYQMKGENAQFSSNSVNGPTLFALFRRPVKPQRTEARVTFNVSTSTITLEARGGDNEFEYFSEPVICVDGSVTYADKGSGYGDGAKLEWDDTLTLSKAQNGALIAHSRGKGRIYEVPFRQDSEHNVLYKFELIPTK